ncbi:MAG: hypothetical protein KDC71_23185, partial [Acidobacteria bacterium]|nr:hypothetical protein [Acidobacteriota bacterium]
MRYFALLPLMLLSLMVYPQNAQEFPSRSGQRTPAARPQTPDLPEELKVAKRKDTEDSAKRRDHVDTRDDRRNPNPRGRDLDDNRFPTRRGDAGRLEREAQDAAEKMANGYGRNLAYREYFQVGFYRGMRNALKDDRLGQWDYQDGIQQGRRDPNARREGRSQGLDLANRIAQEQAVHEVSDQFADLNWRPRPQPNPGRPNFPGAAFASPVDPNLRDLFEAYPLSRWSGFPRDPYLDRWVPEPYRLYECDRYTDFYSNQWREAKRALAAFAQDRRDGAFYRSLNNADKAFFEEEFTDAYLDIMDRIFDTYGDRGYRSGFDCGWDYGAFIQYEISYRKGYNRGVGEAMRQTAESSFFDTYPRAYSAAY